MKKSVGIKKLMGALALSCILLSSCGVSGDRNHDDTDDVERRHAPAADADSEDYKGKDVTSVTSSFYANGFENIVTVPIEDLASKGSTPDGYVESVSINGASFEKDDTFDPEDTVTVTYHTIKRISIPLSEEECNTVSLNALQETFAEAGYIDLSVSEMTDLDPDIYDQEQYTWIYVEGNQINISEQDAYAYDSTVNIERHYTYNKYNLNVQLDFPGNLLFDKYDVTVTLDDEFIATLPHGTDWSGTLRLIEGDHTMLLTKSDDSSIYGRILIGLFEDTDANFTFKCYSNTITPSIVYYQSQLKDDMVRMSYSESRFRYKDYNDVISELQNIGFTNIKTKILYDIYWGITDNGETESVSIAGSRNYGKGDLFKKNDEVIVSYHMPAADNPATPTSTPTPTPKPAATPTPIPTQAPVSNTEMPIMSGSNIKTVVNTAAKYGVKELYEYDFGHGTMCKSLKDSSGGLMLDVIYSTSTGEILSGDIATNKMASDKQQQDFIKAMSAVLCPSADSSEISTWVSANVGNKGTTNVGGFTYELSLGPVNNTLYYAGNAEWEAWETQHW